MPTTVEYNKAVKWLTPRQYLKIKAQALDVISEAEKTLQMALELTNLCPHPDRTRRAEPRDLKPGRIIWYIGEGPGRGTHWTQVSKAFGGWTYEADDGEIYDIGDAYVSLDKEEQ